MAENAAQLLISAKDEASRIIGNVASELGVLGNVLTRIAAGGGIAGLALAGIGAAAGGIVLIGSKLSDAVEQLDRLSSRTGVASENLQVMQEIIVEGGGNAEALTTSLTFLNRAIGQGNPLLAQLGITTKDTFAAFMQLADIFDRSTDSGKKTAIALQLLGRGSGELLGNIHDLASSFDSMKERMEAAGALIGGQTIEQARALDAQMDTLSRNWKGALTRIQATTLPWAATMVRQFNEVWDSIRGVKPSVEFAEDMIAKLEARLAELQKQNEFQSRLAAGQPTTSDAATAPGAALGSKVSEAVRTYYIGLMLDSTEEMKKIAGDLALLKDGMAAGQKAIEAEKNALAAANDALSGVSLDDTKAQEKEKRIKEIMEVLGQTRVQAELTLKSLDAIESASKAEEITKKLTLGPDAGESVKKFNEEVNKTADLLGISVQQAEVLVRNMESAKRDADAATQRSKLGVESEKPIGPEIPDDKRKLSTKESLAEWAKAMDAIMSSATVLDDALNEVFSSLQSGFASAFEGILSGAMSLGDAMKTIFKSIVSAIIAELARIAASAVIRYVILPMLGLPPIPGPSSVARAPAGSSAIANGGTNVTNVYTYDSRDTVRDLLSMSGRQRQAGARLAFLGEY